MASDSFTSQIWPAGSFEMTKSDDPRAQNRDAIRHSPTDPRTWVSANYDASTRSAKLSSVACALAFFVGVVLLFCVTWPRDNPNSGPPYQPPPMDIGEFLWFSDVQVDPHADPYVIGGSPDDECRCRNDNSTTLPAECKTDKNAPYGLYYCDTSIRLLESSLEAAHRVLPKPDFIITTGDLARHERLDDKTKPLSEIYQMELVSTMLAEKFPEQFHVRGPPASAFSLGNTDVRYLDATKGRCNISLLQTIGTSWASGQTPMSLDAAAKEDLSCGGYYAVSLNPALLIVVLNTLLYVPRFADVEDNDTDPLGQFAWLQQQLENARSRSSKVFILGHIAPGIDFYSQTLSWEEKFVQKYTSIVDDHWDVIRAQLYGHEHRNSFKLPPDSFIRTTSPILQVASLSPWYGTVPMFHVVKYDAQTMDLLDIVSYGAPGILKPEGDTGFSTEWKPMLSLAEAYRRFNRLNSKGFSKVLDDLENDDEFLATFLQNMDGRALSELPGKTRCLKHSSDVKRCRADVICSLATILKSEYESCKREINRGGRRGGRRGGPRRGGRRTDGDSHYSHDDFLDADDNH